RNLPEPSAPASADSGAGPSSLPALQRLRLLTPNVSPPEATAVSFCWSGNPPLLSHKGFINACHSRGDSVSTLSFHYVLAPVFATRMFAPSKPKARGLLCNSPGRVAIARSIGQSVISGQLAARRSKLTTDFKNDRRGIDR